MIEIVKQVKDVWSLVVQAPWTFLILALSLLALGCLAAKLYYARIIAITESSRDLLKGSVNTVSHF